MNAHLHANFEKLTFVAVSLNCEKLTFVTVSSNCEKGQGKLWFVHLTGDRRQRVNENQVLSASLFNFFFSLYGQLCTCS